jgi:leucyl-tRNA synthetase
MDELWERLGFEEPVMLHGWPEFDPEATTLDEVTIAVQINGKVRGRITVEINATQDEVCKLALMDDHVRKFTDGKTLRKVIYVPQKILNIVVN